MAKLGMQSMEMDDEDAVDHPMPIDTKKESYPYGLRICLTHKEFEKLGLDWNQAFVGGLVHLHGLARITHVSSSEHESGKSARVEFQIENLEIESEDAEDDENDEEN
jgi:hypothetical protein